jgi:hypothetical protein
VEEYLKLRRSSAAAGGVSRPPARDLDTPSATRSPGLSGAVRRDAEKELSAVDRRLAKLAGSIRAAHDEFAAHDQSDYVGLGALQRELTVLEDEHAALEERWLELSELLEP